MKYFILNYVKHRAETNEYTMAHADGALRYHTDVLDKHLIELLL